jgi:archaellum component FlaC
MDQELIVFLTREFGSLRDELRGDINGLRDELRGDINGLRDELRGDINGLRGEFEAFRKETNERFEKVEDQIHLTQITVENMRDDIQLLAEGVSAFDGKLENVRQELKGEIQDVKALLHQSYGDLDRRIS